MKRIIMLIAIFLSWRITGADTSSPNTSNEEIQLTKMEQSLIEWLKLLKQSKTTLEASKNLLGAQTTSNQDANRKMLFQHSLNGSAIKQLIDLFPDTCSKFDLEKDNPEEWLSERMNFNKIQLARNIELPNAIIEEHIEQRGSCTTM